MDESNLFTYIKLKKDYFAVKPEEQVASTLTMKPGVTAERNHITL